jgi:hypothetical protein
MYVCEHEPILGCEACVDGRCIESEDEPESLPSLLDKASKAANPPQLIEKGASDFRFKGPFVMGQAGQPMELMVTAPQTHMGIHTLYIITKGPKSKTGGPTRDAVAAITFADRNSFKLFIQECLRLL